MAVKGVFKIKKNDFTGLNKLALYSQNAKNYKAQVGILGNTTRRVEGELTNAEIALIHEEGVISKNIPKRSIFNSLNIKIDELKSGIDKIAKETIAKQEPAFNAYFKIALLGLKILKGAFDTEGYGTWLPNKPATIKKKLAKVNPKKRAEAQAITMVETGALENSLTFRVVKKRINPKTKQIEWTNNFKKID
jgi:hypothetical protein